ncbi:MAG TPA: hypothetical protein VHE35_34065 [Kofleriaceae bacterium]|nr:hypothetical protein [Kofleriaceae bacterium]
MTAAASRRAPRHLLLAGLPAVALAALAACVIHLGDDDDTPCAAGVGDPAGGLAAGTLLLDPQTLACVELDFGGDCGCGPCPQPLPPIPTWGACQSGCTGLPEQACEQAPGCRTTYDHDCLTGDGPCTALSPYLGCVAIDTTGPVPGPCEGLDALACSRHDDCLATYRDNGLCDNGLDDDRDGQVDELDECRSFGVCLPELGAE